MAAVRAPGTRGLVDGIVRRTVNDGSQDAGNDVADVDHGMSGPFDAERRADEGGDGHRCNWSGSKMNEDGKTIYRIDQGAGASPRVRRIEARKRIERNAHALVVRTTDEQGLVPTVIREHFADWWYDLRRKQNTIYGGLLRFIDVSILARVPRWMLKMIPRWIDEYIDGEYDASESASVSQRKVA